jgi:hypothetical protein
MNVDLGGINGEQRQSAGTARHVGRGRWKHHCRHRAGGRVTAYTAPPIRRRALATLCSNPNRLSSRSRVAIFEHIGWATAEQIAYARVMFDFVGD